MKTNLTILFFLLLTLQSFSQTDLSLGLQAYYPFNGNANDASSNNNNATFNNATLTTDRLGNLNSAYNFNGSNNYIQIPNSASLSTGSKISLCAWVKPKGFYQGTCHGNSIIDRENDQGAGSYFLFYSDAFYVRGTNCSNPVVDEAHQNFYGPNGYPVLGGYAPFIQKDQWYSVVYTNDGSKAKTYVNCVLIDSNTTTLNFTSNQALLLGRNAGLPYWLNGDLDEVRIYNRAINQAEVNLYGDCFTTPVLLKDFNVLVTLKNKINLIWNVENEIGIKNYTIQRAKSNTDDFITIGNVNARNTGYGAYSFNDPTVEAGLNYYYRITVNEISGTRKYSDIKKAATHIGNELDVSIFPNPSSASFNLLIKKNIGLTDILVVNTSGQIILRKRITPLDNNIITLKLDKQQRGSYWVKIIGSNKTVIKKIIKK